MYQNSWQKKKHCKFSERWNQAEKVVSVLIHLETVLIQGCKVSDILTLAKKNGHKSLMVQCSLCKKDK